MQLLKRFFLFMTLRIRGVAALGCILAGVISFNIVAKGLRWEDTIEALNSTMLLWLSVVHTLVVGVLGLISVRKKTGSPRLRIGTIIGTVGYLHTLIGMVATFGSVSVVINERNPTGLTAAEQKKKEDEAVQDIFAAIGASLGTSVIGWGFGKWIEAGAAEAHEGASVADEMKSDLKRVQGKQRELEASVQAILSVVRQYGEKMVATEGRLAQGASSISASLDAVLRSSSAGQEEFIDEIRRLGKTISDMEGSLPAWDERGQQMLDIQQRIITMQSAMEQTMMGHGNALLGSAHATHQMVKDTAAMLERLKGYLAVIDDSMRKAANDAATLASVTRADVGVAQSDTPLEH